MHRSVWAVCLGVLAYQSACAGRLGYRYSYVDEQARGLYGGPVVGASLSLAGRAEPAHHKPYLGMQASYNIAEGPDFGTVGTTLAWTQASTRKAGLISLSVALEFLNGFGVSVGACGGYGDWGLALGCLRWGSKGYVAGDLSLGFNDVRLASGAHESARRNPDGGSDSDSDWDWDD